MRVISGVAKGIKLKSVPGSGTRPILDRVKTALFDILRPEICEKKVLDLFAGSGSVGIEALSQGAASCIFLDLSRQAIETIRSNLEATHLVGQAEVRQADAFSFLRNSKKSFDLIYIAPPQYKGIWLEALKEISSRPDLLNDNGLAVVQIDPTENDDFACSDLALESERKYGNSLLLFYRKQP